MNIRNEVLYRLYMVLVGVVLVAIFIFGKAVKISVKEGDKWRAKGIDSHFSIKKIEANRGNIFAEGGNVLATSLPFFDIAFDPVSSGMKKKDFDENIDSLAYCLATYVDNSYTVGGYRDMLLKKREDSVQYIPIKKGVTLLEKNKISEFPLFNMGRYRGGFITEQKFKRERIYGILAHRTIGYIRDNIKPVGLEGYFDDVLKGVEGEQLMYKVGGNRWIPVDDLAKIEPVSGSDIVTTLDIDLQEITEVALHKAVEYHDAEYGVAILMEVETGAIRAIANLSKKKSGKIWENYNHAIGSATEPGSTFKLAAVMALLEDGYIELEDTVHLEQGRKMYYKEEMVDASIHTINDTTIRYAFEISSNVGISKIVQKHYGGKRRAKRFIRRLESFNLHQPTGVEIKGEPIPFINNPESELWSGTAIPWMATGYGVKLTPLQMLTFYNAVANDGKLMKPYLVSEIQRFGKTEKSFKPIVVKSQIASKSTIRKAKSLLEGVVLRGTAKKGKTDKYNFAGKTGTVQVEYKNENGKKKKAKGHQGSFIGYFPAENPKYSCIVVIYKPKKNGYFGSTVALPVFREIADKTFSLKMDLHQAVNIVERERNLKKQLPQKYSVGNIDDFQQVMNYLDIPVVRNTRSAWGRIKTMNNDTISLYPKYLKKDEVPDVRRMGLKDALYILENKGLRVKVKGYGKVSTQSIKPGTKVRGQKIVLTLN